MSDMTDWRIWELCLYSLMCIEITGSSIYAFLCLIIAISSEIIFLLIFLTLLSIFLLKNGTKKILILLMWQKSKHWYIYLFILWIICSRVTHSCSTYSCNIRQYNTLKVLHWAISLCGYHRNSISEDGLCPFNTT